MGFRELSCLLMEMIGGKRRMDPIASFILLPILSHAGRTCIFHLNPEVNPRDCLGGRQRWDGVRRYLTNRISER